MGGFSEEEKSSYIAAINANIWDSLQSLINASEQLGIPLSEKAAAIAEQFKEPYTTNLTGAQVDAATTFWSDAQVQKIYQERHKFQLNDSCKYYLDDIKRVTTPNYVPTDQDILRSRIQTTGIIETKFEIDAKSFVLVDVGGQRSERKKWMHCFEDVTGVLFCVGLSAFDQTLYEDNKTNRMHEALKLFHEICQSKWFTSTAMILFLNKDDLFREKIKQGKNIKLAFDDYLGPAEYEASIKFITDKFISVTDPVTGKPKNIYTHTTCATDTTGVKAVFNACKDFILNQAFQKAGLM